MTVEKAIYFLGLTIWIVLLSTLVSLTFAEDREVPTWVSSTNALFCLREGLRRENVREGKWMILNDNYSGTKVHRNVEILAVNENLKPKKYHCAFNAEGDVNLIGGAKPDDYHESNTIFDARAFFK